MAQLDRTKSPEGEAFVGSTVFDKILVAVGTVEDWSRAADAALTLARLSHGDVMVVHAVDVQKCCSGGAEDLDGTFGVLNEVVTRFRAAGVTCEGLVWRSVNRSVTDGLLNAIAEYQPSLVVLPDDRPSGLRRLVGHSICEAIGRRAACSVMSVPQARA